MKKLAIVTTHPIQYNAPLYRLLAQRRKVAIKVFYTWGESVLQKKFDPGFGKNIEWDIPLTEGYPFEFVENIAKDKGSHHFTGINNPALTAQIEKWDADAVLVFGWAFKSHLRVMRYFKGKIPVLFRGDSVSMHVTGVKRLLRKFWLKWVYRHVDTALFVGSLNKEYFLENGLKQDQLLYAPHAVDNDRFEKIASENSAEIASWRGGLGISDSDVVFLYAGKLDANKNVSHLINSFQRLNETEAHLVIAGNGDEEQMLRSLAAGSRRIHFTGFVNQSRMPLLYGVCDVFILPSLTETWGLALNEAMACGKAVVCSSGCGAAPNLVVNGINGFVFHNAAEDELKEILLKLAFDKELTGRMGWESKRIIEGHNFAAICAAIENCMAWKN